MLQNIIIPREDYMTQIDAIDKHKKCRFRALQKQVHLRIYVICLADYI